MICVKRYYLNVFVFTYSSEPTLVDTLDAVSLSFIHLFVC